MVYGKEEYNIDLSNDKHLDQIEFLIKMYKNGVDVKVFDKFTDNVNNRFKSYTDPDRKKELHEWEDFFSQFSPKETIISQEQLCLLFQYMQKYSRKGNVQIKEDQYHSTLERIEMKKGYKLEYLVLKTLEKSS